MFTQAAESGSPHIVILSVFLKMVSNTNLLWCHHNQNFGLTRYIISDLEVLYDRKTSKI